MHLLMRRLNECLTTSKNDKQVKITVAIPCYNLEDRIGACLESVISQDYKDFEIIVIDDCSTDDSVDVINEVINKHLERDIRLIINEMNLGLCKIRNIAIDEAKGESLFFVDGDDSIEQGTISMFQHRMEQTHVDVVCGSFRKNDFNGNTYIIKQFPEDTLKGKFSFASYIEKYVNGYFNLGIWNNLYRLDFLKTHDIYCNTNYQIFEDRLFTFMVVMYASGVSYINEVTYNYNDVPTSICHQNNDNAFLPVYRAIITSVFDKINSIQTNSREQTLPYGIRFLRDYICMSDGLLRKCMKAEASRCDKISLLKWLRNTLHNNDVNWSNIVGPYNRLSYLILISPFPYQLFQIYFNHLKFVKKVFISLKLSNKSYD